MTNIDLPAEPADKSFVVWFDQNGDPYAVYYRVDERAESAELTRWFTADQFEGSLFEAWSWEGLREEMDGFDGPHLLTLVRSESPAVSS